MKAELQYVIDIIPSFEYKYRLTKKYIDVFKEIIQYIDNVARQGIYTHRDLHKRQNDYIFPNHQEFWV